MADIAGGGCAHCSEKNCGLPAGSKNTIAA